MIELCIFFLQHNNKLTTNVCILIVTASTEQCQDRKPDSIQLTIMSQNSAKKKDAPQSNHPSKKFMDIIHYKKNPLNSTNKKNKLTIKKKTQISLLIFKKS